MANAITSVLTIAASQIGTKESPAGSNKQKYGVWYPMNGSPWCAIFVSWCFAQAGYEKLLPSGKRFASCAVGVNGAKSVKRWHAGTSGIQPGDVVFFDWQPNGAADHVGIVESVIKGGIVTIEGNTGVGEGVYRCTRKASIMGYFRPAWPSGTTTPPATTTPVSTLLVVDGIWGSATSNQFDTMLNKKGAGMKLNGTFTTTSCGWLQKYLGTNQDKRVSGQPTAVRKANQKGWASTVYKAGSTSGGSLVFRALAKHLDTSGFTAAAKLGIVDASYVKAVQRWLNAGGHL